MSEEQKPKQKMTQEERKRLDRQRFLGIETQKRLLEAKVLVTPLNGPNTELIKNLALAGVNVTIYDDHTLTNDDFEVNFLVALDEIGKNRGEVILQKIQQMNPTGNYTLIPTPITPSSLSPSCLKSFSFICTSFTSFTVIEEWDKISKELNIPYYNIFPCGLYSLCYISLGTQYIYGNDKKFEIKGLSFEQCVQGAEGGKGGKGVLKGFLGVGGHQGNKGDEGEKGDKGGQEERKEQDEEEGKRKKEDTKVGEKNTELEREVEDIRRMFGVEYCPTYSIIGSIVSQEIIKVLGNQEEPAVNWIVTNSIEGYSTVVKVKSQQEKITLVSTA